MKPFALLILTLSTLASFNIISAQTVTIGKQVWTTKNLNVSTFRNGDPIPQAKTADSWNKAGINKTPAWCYYENNPNNGTKYGKLYNWYAVNDPRGLAPAGYHIPSDSEWEELKEFLGDRVSSKMKCTNGWPDFGTFSGNGTNSSGFSALPGGIGAWPFAYAHTSSNMKWINPTIGSWWSSTEDTTSLVENGLKSGKVFVFVKDYFAYARSLDANEDDDFARHQLAKFSGNSVRCIKD